MKCDSGRRYLLPESELFFHLPTTVTQPLQILDKEFNEEFGEPDPAYLDEEIEHHTRKREQQIEALRQMILPELTDASQELRGSLSSFLDRVPRQLPELGEDGDCRITFDGIKAAELGLCELTQSPHSTFVELTNSHLRDLPDDLLYDLFDLDLEPGQQRTWIRKVPRIGRILRETVKKVRKRLKILDKFP
jgi:hypothetical protein